MSTTRVRIAAVLCVAGLSILASAPALAGADCSVTATTVAFGTYDPFLTSPDDSTGTVTVTCVYMAPGNVDKVDYTVSLSAGGSGSYTQRRLTVGSAFLGYNLFQDGARSLVWGDGSASTVIASGSMTVGPGVGNGTRTHTHTVYARIPSLQDVAAGDYTDSIVLTLTF